MIKESHIEQLEKRGISEEIASRLGWYSLENENGSWLAIPYFRKGTKVGTKYRRIDGRKEFFQDKGSEQCLYNLSAIDEIGTSSLIITEGELDCAIALQCGFLAVSVPNGAPNKPVESDGNKYNYLDDIPENCELILCVDDDDAGANLLHDLSLRLNPIRCKWVKYPKGCKDLNDAFIKYGQRGVEETIRRAQWCKIDGIYSMSEIPPMPYAEPIPCPVDGLGNNFKIRLGDFTVITGVPGFGKTTLVNEIACGMAKLYNWPIAIASFEQNPKQDHLRALRTYYAEKPANLLNDEQRVAADEWIEKYFTFLIPSIDEEATLKWVLDKAIAAIMRKGAKMIIIDPWNELDHDFPGELTLTRYTGFAIKQFKKMAQKYMVHVIVIAHPAKLMKQKNGSYPVPTLYDISDSAHWYNKSDLGIVVHRNADKSSLVKIAKVRYWNTIGLPGEFTLKFNDYNNRFIHEAKIEESQERE